jgi:hypothetical protein
MKISIGISLFALLIIFLAWQNNGIVITKYEYANKKLPEKFNGFKVLHISDLHNKNYGERLINKIKKINPDIIVITGDLIDRRKTMINTAADFIDGIVKIAPTYYVSGNHEQLSKHFDELKTVLHKSNVIIMDNSYATLYKNGFSIGLIGIADPAINFGKKTYLKENNFSYVRDNITKLIKDINTDFNVLLSHRPELFSVYNELEIDLVFSGHAHGGQIRIPFVGGVLSPNQGFFPKYSEGMHSEGVTSIVVSRGLGNSVFPFRIFNRPELVLVTLKSE